MKEQLKKMGSFEYHQTSFSYRNNETMEETYVGVPEEGGRALISADPLAPGSVYAASVSGDGKAGLYRIEVGTSVGTGKLKTAGGVDGGVKACLNRAFGYLQGHKVQLGLGSLFDSTDMHVEVIDLLANRIECEAGVAFLVALVSALRKAPVAPGLVILGDLSIQGNIKPHTPCRTLQELHGKQCAESRPSGKQRISSRKCQEYHRAGGPDFLFRPSGGG